MDGTGIRRAGAIEQRFVVDDSTAGEILSWARRELAADPHGGGPHQDAYTVTTSYLDNPNFDTFFRRGSYGRAKYRIRRYGEEEDVFVERKLRTASMLAKRRTRVPLDALEEALRRAEGEIAWFSRRLAPRDLRPVCTIVYDRVARELTLAAQVARLTVDSHVCGSRADGAPFRWSAGIPLLDSHSIVELKYQGHPPPILKALAERFIMTPRKISKYRAAVEALQLSPRTKTSLMEQA